MASAILVRWSKVCVAGYRDSDSDRDSDRDRDRTTVCGKETRKLESRHSVKGKVFEKAPVQVTPKGIKQETIIY